MLEMRDLKTIRKGIYVDKTANDFVYQPYIGDNGQTDMWSADQDDLENHLQPKCCVLIMIKAVIPMHCLMDLQYQRMKRMRSIEQICFIILLMSEDADLFLLLMSGMLCFGKTRRYPSAGIVYQTFERFV